MRPAGLARQPAKVLHPGDVALARRGERLQTLLGSCVAVLLTDRMRTTAAMCHIVHAGDAPASRPRNTAWARPAMRAMYGLLLGVAIIPQRCEAHVFGGGHVLASHPHQFDVGHANVDWVLDFLAHEGMPVCSHSTGGHCYRTIDWTVGDTDPLQAVKVVDMKPPGTFISH